MSAAVVDQLVVENRTASRPFQWVPPSQQVPSACTRALTSWVTSSRVAEPHDHLVQDHVVEDLDAGFGRHQLGEPARVRAAAVDQVGDAVAPSWRIAAQTAKPRARRDASGT